MRKKLLYFGAAIAVVSLFNSECLAQVYIKEIKERTAVDPRPHYGELFFISALVDVSTGKNLFKKASETKEACEKKYPRLSDFVLFNSDPTGYFDSLQKLKMFRQVPGMTEGFVYGPPSLRHFTDSAKTHIDSLHNLVYYAEVNPEKYIQPFYFRKYEVTNNEYRQFVNWVRDSIARLLLAEKGHREYLEMGAFNDSFKLTNYRLNWKTKINWGSPELEGLYRKVTTRFYNRREIETQKLIYTYTETGGNKVSLNIFPDTLSWMQDYSYGYNEPMTNMYFWHPAYDAYPVVGISYTQVRAFLYWKTTEENKLLAAQKKNYRLSYSLPTEIEWEIASVSLPSKGVPAGYNEFSFHLYDHSWNCDLSVRLNDHYKKKLDNGQLDSASAPKGQMIMDQLYQHSHLNDRYFGNYVINGTFHTATVFIGESNSNVRISRTGNKKTELDIKLVESDLDPNKICYMGGNVSEWIEQDYNNYRVALQWRQKYLQLLNQQDADIQAQIEKHFSATNFHDGKMIRGANWEDERLSSRLGKNIAGITAKKFIDPSSKHCTLGFRYVVHLVFVN